MVSLHTVSSMRRTRKQEWFVWELWKGAALPTCRSRGHWLAMQLSRVLGDAAEHPQPSGLGSSAHIQESVIVMGRDGICWEWSKGPHVVTNHVEKLLLKQCFNSRTGC
jgi:hypothetical protein